MFDSGLSLIRFYPHQLCNPPAVICVMKIGMIRHRADGMHFSQVHLPFTNLDDLVVVKDCGINDCGSRQIVTLAKRPGFVLYSFKIDASFSLAIVAGA